MVEIEMNKLTVSIIIPVYNAEKSVSISLDSILNQSYPHIEVVVVNDCSTDNSQVVLEQYNTRFHAKGYSYVVLTHEYNQGVASARNTGLEHVSGQYVYFVDADDYIVEDCISTFIASMEGESIDIVGCNWWLKMKKDAREMKQPQVCDPIGAIEMMAKGVMRWNLWLFMVNRQLYEQNAIRFLDGINMGEDMLVMFKLFSHASSVKLIDRAMYFYDKSNENSLTNIYSDKHKKEVSLNLEALDSYFSQSRGYLEEKWREWVNYLKLNIKLPLLISDKRENYEEWGQWYSEANSFILKNNRVSKKIKLLQYMAYHRQYWFLRLYHFLVQRVMYGIIYR